MKHLTLAVLQDNDLVDNKVLALVILDRVLPSLASRIGDLKVEAYDNGREQGYTIFTKAEKAIYKNVSFSEYRSSDDIVVYRDFVKPDGSFDDDAYRTRTYFHSDENGIDKAVAFIVSALRS
jgi:hypothetical protein